MRGGGGSEREVRGGEDGGEGQRSGEELCAYEIIIFNCFFWLSCLTPYHLSIHLSIYLCISLCR